MIDGTKIVITTLQKFPFVLRGLLHAAGAERADEASAEEKQQAKAWEAEIAKRRYAVIVDEAHHVSRIRESDLVMMVASHGEVGTAYAAVDRHRLEDNVGRSFVPAGQREHVAGGDPARHPRQRCGSYPRRRCCRPSP